MWSFFYSIWNVNREKNICFIERNAVSIWCADDLKCWSGHSNRPITDRECVIICLWHEQTHFQIINSAIVLIFFNGLSLLNNEFPVIFSPQTNDENGCIECTNKCFYSTAKIVESFK